MELIVIDERRIKLTLTAEETERYGVAESGGRGMRERLNGIMAEACRTCGYAGAVLRGRIYVEMYPSKKGGCELFVTRLPEREQREGKSETERENGSIMKTGNEGILAEYRKYIFRGRVIYSFESMEHLLGACLGLMRIGYGGESAAYCDEAKRMYYLILEQESHIAAENLGTLCRSSVYYYINEHCRRLCTDAVAILGKLA